MLVAPKPACSFLAVFKSPTSVHEEPFQVSVNADEGGVTPPNANAAVYVPADPK